VFAPDLARVQAVLGSGIEAAEATLRSERGSRESVLSIIDFDAPKLVYNHLAR
jgi:hypothetical protein